MRALAKNLLLLGVVSALCLLLAELALRIALPPDTSGWAGVPSLEDRAGALPPRTPGETRVLALGDSFTEYRDHVDENWVRYAEARAQQEGIRLVAMNLGQMGTGLRHYLRNLQDYGAAAKPDLVLVGVYLGNDILDYELDLRKEALGMTPASANTRGRRSSGWKGALKRNSRLLTLLNALLLGQSAELDDNLAHAASLYGLDAAAQAAALTRIDAAMLEMARQNRINPWDLAFAVVAPERYRQLLAVDPDSHIPAALERFFAEARQIDAASRALGAPSVFVLIPVQLQVDERYHEYLRRVGFEVTADMAQPTALSERLHAFFAREGMRVIDPLPALQRSREDLYLPMDTHWSPAGQRVAGEAVYEQLRAWGLLSPGP